MTKSQLLDLPLVLSPTGQLLFGATGRLVRPGLVARGLDYVRPGRTERAVARALGIHDGVQDRALRTLAEVEAEIERLMR